MAVDFADRIALHSWTLDTTPLADLLRVAKDAGYAGVELRYLDFERLRDEGLTNEQILDLIGSSGIPTVVLGAEWGVMYAQGDERARQLESFELTCANAVALGCPVVMTSPGFNPTASIEHAAGNFRACGEIAQRHGVRVAVEFNPRHETLNSLAYARELLALADHPACGLLLDAFHMHHAGVGGRGWAEVPTEDILAFQFSDAPPGPMPQVRRALDRLPPGKGVVDWTETFRLLAEKGYQGYIDYEAPNPAQWNRPPDEVALEGITLTRQLLEAAFAD